MKLPRPSETAWSKISRIAALSPQDSLEPPFGFATRVVAAWKADRREGPLAAFEWLTLRGLAVAFVIFAGSAAFGYDTVADVVVGEASIIGGWLDVLPLNP